MKNDIERAGKRLTIQVPTETLEKISGPTSTADMASIDAYDEVNDVKSKLSPDEFGIEQRLAAGETFRIIAASLNISSGALRVRVSRWRQRLRKKCD